MAVLATLEAAIEQTPAAGLLAARVVTAGDPGLELTVTNNTVLVDAALPAPGVRQDAGFSVYLDGTRVDPKWFAGPISVRMRVDELATWSLVTVVGSPFGLLLGSGYRGAPPGLTGVKICGIYRLADGTTEEIPLITNGIAHAAEVSAPGGRLMRIEGVDAGGRYDRNVVTLVLPPFHHTPRSDVVRLMAEAAGVPPEDIELTEGDDLRPMDKPVNFVDLADWIAETRKMQATTGLALMWDGDGKLTNPATKWFADRVKGSLYDRNFIDASFRGSLDTPTAAQFTGFTLVEPDAEIVTETVESNVVGPYQAPAIVASINSDCTETPVVESFPPVERTLLRTFITEEVHQSREVLSSVQTSERYFHRERSHNFLDTGGGLVGCVTPNWRFDNGKVSGERETFRLTEEIRLVRTFGEDDYIVSEVSTISRYQWIEEYHVTDAGVFNVQRRLESGEPVTTLDEPYVLAERLTTVYTVADGVISQVVETLEDYHARPGAGYVYLNGKTSSAPEQSFQIAKITTKLYTALDEATLQTLETAVDLRNGETTTTVSKEIGSLPAAPFLDDAPVKTAELSWKTESEDLLLTRPPYLLKQTDDWIEVWWHAKGRARRTLREESALIFTATMPAMFLMRPPSWWRVFTEATGETSTTHMRFDEVTHEWAGPPAPGSPGNPILTRIAGVKYVLYFDENQEEQDEDEGLA